MMKIRDFIGMPVISIDRGRKIGEVRDFLVYEWEISGLLLDAKHWFSATRCVSWEGIGSFGKDAVMIADPEAICKFGDFTEQGRCFLSGNKKLQGLPVMMPNGSQLGYIEDVYFDEKMGKQITAMELTDGFISDLTEGRKVMLMKGNVNLGEDAVIVPNGMEFEGM